MKAFEVYPEAKYLIYVMKCLLRQRDLHETYSGGIGSFLLFCMVISFLREFRKDFVKKGERANLNEVLLSEYLLNMMDFYGSRFDFQRKRIIMTNVKRLCKIGWIHYRQAQHRRPTIFN
jgi:non-canonical poly(A) RNA polymerase PAPD5/7